MPPLVSQSHAFPLLLLWQTNNICWTDLEKHLLRHTTNISAEGQLTRTIQRHDQQLSTVANATGFHKSCMAEKQQQTIDHGKWTGGPAIQCGPVSTDQASSIVYEQGDQPSTVVHVSADQPLSMPYKQGTSYSSWSMYQLTSHRPWTKSPGAGAETS